MEDKKDVYDNLPPALQMKYRKAWGVTKDWDWYEEMKTSELYDKTAVGQKRVWMTRKMLAKEFGGADDKECALTQRR